MENVREWSVDKVSTYPAVSAAGKPLPEDIFQAKGVAGNSTMLREKVTVAQEKIWITFSFLYKFTKNHQNKHFKYFLLKLHRIS